MAKRKAFTLIELIVAMAVLAIVLSFAGLIFRVSIDSHRMALANAEIMQKLRVITEQLDTDFKGVILDYGGVVKARVFTYTIDDEDGEVEMEINTDSVVVFAQGDFQSTGQYDIDGEIVTISGNVAALYYGPPDLDSYARLPEPRERILLRRQTILASEVSPEHSDPNGEYYATSLHQWYAGSGSADWDGWVEMPVIEPGDIKANQPMYLAKGVDNFTVYYLERDDPIGTDALAWQRRLDNDRENIRPPRALKFEFTLHDSRGIIKNGRTFTHIVYLGS